MMTPEEFRDAAAFDFANRAIVKFDKGRTEHGGGSILECQNLVGQVEEELIDGWHYIKSIRVKIQEAINRLDNSDTDEAKKILKKLIHEV
jgi:hypothetical protein